MSRESAPVRVLLVSRNVRTIEFLCQHTQQLSMHVEISCGIDSAMRKLCHTKFEGVIIDFELGDETLRLVDNLRSLTSNSRAISCAIVDSEASAKAALQGQANFVLRCPLSAPEVVRTLRAAYPMMFRERRRDYRYPIEVKTLVKIDAHPEFAASSINISETGIAINSPTPLNIGTRIHLRLDLPKMADPLSTSGEVCWTDGNGRAGIHFVDLPGRPAERLQLWLAERMDELVPAW